MKTRKISGSWSYGGGEYVVTASIIHGASDPAWCRAFGTWLPGDDDELEILSVVEDSDERKPRADLLDAASTDARLLDRLAEAASIDAVEEMYERAERMAVDY